MMMLGRAWNAGNSHRYGFNGKEQDAETYGEGNIYDYGFRIYNPRSGKFLSRDPLAMSYPYYTPYSFAGNKPINSIDIEGAEELLVIRYFDNNGKYVGTTLIRVANADQRDAGKRNGGDMQVIELNQSMQSTINALQSGDDISDLEPILKNGGAFQGRYFTKMQSQYIKKNNDIIATNSSNAPGSFDNVPEQLKFRTTTVHFLYDDKIEVPSISGSELDAIKKALENDPERMINIYGYSSSEGDDDYNMQLSVERANGVREYLIANGIDSSRILEVEGRGETEKFGTGSGNYSKNRVAEISFTYEEH